MRVWAFSALMRLFRLFGCVLAGALTFVPARIESQKPPRPNAPSAPLVAVLPFAFRNDAGQSDTTAIEQGIAALLESQLAREKRIRVAGHDGSDFQRAQSLPESAGFVYTRVLGHGNQRTQAAL